jgi:uncharacterized protein (TIGR02145 family)
MHPRFAFTFSFLCGLSALMGCTSYEDNPCDPASLSSDCEEYHAPNRWCYADGNCGTFVDARPGAGNREYKWTKIGDQVWMAENLDFGSEISTEIDQENDTAVEKYCYDNDPSSCASYGGLYMWAEAMDLPSICNSTFRDVGECIQATPHQGICPNGWHLPGIDEWQQLTAWVEANDLPSSSGSLVDLASTSWIVPGILQGTNNFGFDALPGGTFFAAFNVGSRILRVSSGEGRGSGWWTTKNPALDANTNSDIECGGSANFAVNVQSSWADTSSNSMQPSGIYESGIVGTCNQKHLYGFSVRCVKD